MSEQSGLAFNVLTSTLYVQSQFPIMFIHSPLVPHNKYRSGPHSRFCPDVHVTGLRGRRLHPFPAGGDPEERHQDTRGRLDPARWVRVPNQQLTQQTGLQRDSGQEWARCDQNLKVSLTSRVGPHRPPHLARHGLEEKVEQRVLI